MLTVTLSTRLKELRQKQGLTQMQLGQKARLTPQFISGIERGHLRPYPKQMDRIARALRVSVREVFADD